jgi:hypothetical protein
VKVKKIGSRDAGVFSDVMEAEIVYSETYEGESSDGSSVQPFFGKYGGDDRGHIVGASLGGTMTPENLTSQALGINRGAIKKFETEIRKILTEHKDWTAHLRVEMLYNEPSCELLSGKAFYYRPYQFNYSVEYKSPRGWMEGQGASQSFRNVSSSQ